MPLRRLFRAYELGKRHDADVVGKRIALRAGVRDQEFVELEVGQGDTH